jgi:undecaprenyl diphosphate synthase
VRLALIGDSSAFGPELNARLKKAVERTAANTRLTLVIALNYGSRAELAAAARALGAKVAAGELQAGEIDEAALAGQLQTRDLPELDLLIRTSGEMRLSNFLLWQAAYAELLFLDLLWPDFDEQAFADALDRFAARQRRFGGRGAAA